MCIPFQRENDEGIMMMRSNFLIWPKATAQSDAVTYPVYSKNSAPSRVSG